jgi:hypothetical protein
MTFERLGEMFKGDRHVRQKNSSSVDGGTSGPFKRAQTGSEDPHPLHMGERSQKMGILTNFR